ncbi:MAG: voltage-gated chloride channel [Nitrospirae bacterium]|nr:MAG: voltage-gated chloride channel [Nitrospirota bacterium]
MLHCAKVLNVEGRVYMPLITRQQEFLILLGSLLKWTVLGGSIGLLVGASTTVFLHGLDLGLHLIRMVPHPFLLLPVGLAFSGWLTLVVAVEAAGHGTERVIQAIHRAGGMIPGRIIPIKLMATLSTLFCGGSAGTIGPCVQIGSGLSFVFAQLLRFDELDRKKLVICGLSAGFATVLGAPIAGAIFGLEVLYVGRLLYNTLFPSLMAALVAVQCATILNAPIPYWSSLTPVTLTPLSLAITGCAGVFFGLCTVLTIELFYVGRLIACCMGLRGPFLGLAGGLILIPFGMGNAHTLGLGWEIIQQALAGHSVLWYLFLLKIVTTSLTLNFGGSGGILLPLCFIGATSGTFFAMWLPLDSQTAAALGMVSLLAGAANTPLTAIFLAGELFGIHLLPLAALTIVISYHLTGFRSIIPTQLLMDSKSSSLLATLGQEIEQVAPRLQERPRSLMSWLRSYRARLPFRR